jgi:calcium-dependent protein kinase
MTNEEEDEIRKLFISFDEDGDGKLSKQELLNGFAGLSVKLNVDSVLDSCDVDGNGYIEYTEFLTAANNWRAQLSETRLKSVFDAFDEDGNGTISLEEFKSVVDDGDEMWEKIIRRADKNGDGEIDFEEFKRSLKKRVKRRKTKKTGKTAHKRRSRGSALKTKDTGLDLLC